MAYNAPRTIVVQFPPNLARWLPVVPILIVVLWLVFTSWYTIPAESVGVVLRFGHFEDIRQPGLHFKLPFGIDEILPVAVKRQQKFEFGFGTSGATNPRQFSDEQDREKNMVTGDLNTALVEWVVQYRLDDLAARAFFVFHQHRIAQVKDQRIHFQRARFVQIARRTAWNVKHRTAGA